ncbi:vascular endothelial growth factor receptor 1-like isoform X2 [Neocloeon triangulifer]|uniref:vascular endothelial growth factor receptor 1-like isoform X2 n=1 Tax=Neocloeon triangulifer TaxID=2078957 RepID=UPI00286F009E|nr:vascular endothelial growth factor receptor 1-like isoform X2 [Neocloeon triangulifer]
MKLEWRQVALVLLFLSTAKCLENYEEYVMSSTITLWCVGEGELTWRFHPDYLVNNFKAASSSVGQQRGRALLKYKPQRFVITIENVQLNDTGTYSCYENGVMKNSTHVFVHEDHECGKEIVPLDDAEMANFVVGYGEDFIIPCRTTKKNAKVSIRDPHESDTAYEFDPKLGFIVRNASLRAHNNWWVCEAEKPPECEDPWHEDTILFTVNVTFDEKLIRPRIKELKENIVREGDGICLECEIYCKDDKTKLVWLFPNGTVIPSSDRFALQESTKRAGRGVDSVDPVTLTLVLSISNFTAVDAGAYVCQVKDRKNLTARIVLETSNENVAKPRLYLSIDNKGAQELVFNETQMPNTVRWVVNYAPSDATVQWFLPDGRQTTQNSKHNITNSRSKKQKSFVINSLHPSDAGVHKIVASVNGSREELNLTLRIIGKPIVHLMNLSSLYYPGTSYAVGCQVINNQNADFTWEFKCMNHNKKIDCDTLHKHNLGFRIPSSPLHISNGSFSSYFFHANMTGNLTCNACNEMGCGSNSTIMIVTNRRSLIQLVVKPNKVYEGDDVQISCYVPKYPCVKKWEWSCQRNESFEPKILITSDSVRISSSEDKYSYFSEVTISQVQSNQYGNYICKAKCEQEGGHEIQHSYSLDPRRVITPKFQKLKYSKEISVTEGKSTELDCEVEADPQPLIQWFRNMEPINETEQGGGRFKIPYATLSDDGNYECRVSSRGNYISREFHLIVTTKSSWNPLVLIPILIVLVLLMSVVIYLLRAVKKEKMKVQRLTAQDVKLFLEGATENIDFTMALDQQADLLPYNPNYEFPREHLKLGRQLGSGAFGRVVRAEASAPLFGTTTDFESSAADEQEPHNPTIVAVKMVKPSAELSQIKALMTELKILIHVGKHLNVVNLLGACTSNLSNKELLVIVEYCRFGNLHSYLLRQRDNFVDQVNHLKDTLDFSIGAKDEDEMHYENHSVIMEQKQVLFKNETRTIIYEPDCDNKYHGEATSTTDGSSVTEHWTTKYRSDFKGELKRITTKDLVCWSYQVARGMQYLASRRIVHADLAARNILLAENNVVKICDFGLARNLYNDANYLKKGDDPLPVKWMAIESIQDRVFSSESDVWSFGIVLWEFFTLARTPYPGIPLDEYFLPRLSDGYRMEKPQYATSQIYRIMRSCWDGNSSKRPDFSELVNKLGQILDDNVKQFYLDLSGPYIRMNSLQQEIYEKELRLSSSKETPARVSDVKNLGCEANGKQNAVNNPMYTVLPTKTGSYVNLSKGISKEADVDSEGYEGYLKMNPSKSEKASIYTSRESSVNV